MIFDIIAAIGSLATFGSFFFFFLKDKDKQSQLDKLTGIATSLDAQNETMKKQNDLIVQQVEILRNTSLDKGNNSEAIFALREIEEKKLKLSVKPNLWISGSSCDGGTKALEITLSNKGEDAKILDYKLISDDITLQRSNFPLDLDKGQKQKIFGKQSGYKHIQNCRYKIHIIFIDKLTNRYKSVIDGIGPKAQITESSYLM